MWFNEVLIMIPLYTWAVVLVTSAEIVLGYYFNSFSPGIFFVLKMLIEAPMLVYIKMRVYEGNTGI